jgi:tetratricopeptide (TPR) repeat protein
VDAAIEELRDRAARYPAARYPVQRATAEFQLGLAWTNRGRPDAAVAALREAVRLFASTGMRLEHGKSLNALGAALRLLGRGDEAAGAFVEAAGDFESSGAPLERGAALFNLGLARRDLGDPAAAAEAFGEASRLLDSTRVPAQSAAAMRELGSALLETGDLTSATGPLEAAVDLAERAADLPGLGAAANALGLARLAGGSVDGALDAFRVGLAATPRALRPEEHAMLKANQALAYERAGDARRARLAARHALASRGAPAEQAAEILTRLGPGADDLAAVLAEEPEDRHSALVREEVARWSETPDGEAAAWIDLLLTRPQLAEPLLAVLLELPPEPMERLIRELLEQVRGRSAEERARLRAVLAGAMARFHAPQLVRLRDTFERLSRDVGVAERWT